MGVNVAGKISGLDELLGQELNVVNSNYLGIL